MDKTNTAVIARHAGPKDGVASARLCPATQYSRDASHNAERPRRTGSPGQAGRIDSRVVAAYAKPQSSGEHLPHAVFAAFNPSRASTASRIKNFWIFPVTVIGNSSTNST